MRYYFIEKETIYPSTFILLLLLLLLLLLFYFSFLTINFH